MAPTRQTAEARRLEPMYDPELPPAARTASLAPSEVVVSRGLPRPVLLYGGG